MSGLLAYVVITAARDEADYIELTIESVIRQRARPLRWVIVSDGSTDATEAIVEKYRARHEWIELVAMPARRERHFAGKFEAFNAGHDRIRGLEYDLLVALDADTSFDEDYFEFLLGKFADDPGLGVGGTPFHEDGQSYDFRFSSVEHVAGACQVFRRECFETIGGYMPLEGGGADVVAVLTARMKGWRTRSFTDRTYRHLRPVWSAQHGPAMARFKLGERDYVLGGHPLWELSRSAYQATRAPLVVGGCMLLCGYVWAMLRRAERPGSRELIRFHRREQMSRLRRFITG